MTRSYCGRPIETSYSNPPIPTRAFDWCAYFDDVGADCSIYGWGETEREAINNLIEQYEEEIAA
jgi:hypothetical protein